MLSRHFTRTRINRPLIHYIKRYSINNNTDNTENTPTDKEKETVKPNSELPKTLQGFFQRQSSSNDSDKSSHKHKHTPPPHPPGANNNGFSSNQLALMAA